MRDLCVSFSSQERSFFDSEAGVREFFVQYYAEQERAGCLMGARESGRRAAPPPSCIQTGTLLALKCREGMMHPRQSCSNVKDVATVAGVSTATVSRVTNDLGNVSEVTRRRVLAAISRLGYRPNLFASELGRANAGIPRRRDRSSRSASM